jgi:flagellar hook-associated protein 1
MRSAFFGLTTLLRSLQAHQRALDTTNHNIANANTNGYSRQLVSLAATTPYTLVAPNRPAGTALQIGTGVMVEQIRRQRDAFTDLQLRLQMQQQTMWGAVAGGLQEVEAIFNEPGNNGLRTLVSNFFNAWSDLANNPQSGGARTAVRATGEALAYGFNDLATRLANSRQDVSTGIALKVPEVNSLGGQLAYLNVQIRNAIAAGDRPNDLMDQRDRVIDDLVKLTGATYRQESTGEVTVLLGGRTFVVGDRVNTLTTEPRYLANGISIHDVKWVLDYSVVKFDGGEIGGMIHLRDELIPERQRQVDLLASTIAGTVNQTHRAGFGINYYADKVSNFFSPGTAVPLSQTGLGHDILGGTIRVGNTTIDVNPMVQSISDVMAQITAAINATPGVTAAANWALDPETGRIAITYQSAAPVAIGGPGDTSNLLQLLGLRGAPDTVTDSLTNDRRVSGQGSVALFSAAWLSLDQAIKNDIDAIATAAGASAGLASATGPGDNRIALALAALQRTAFSALGDNSFEAFYASSVADLGAITRRAEQTAITQKMLVEHLEARRESLSGVSLDEEATQLIRYQRAYQAAARGISAVDEMLETIILRMGRVGN